MAFLAWASFVMAVGGAAQNIKEKEKLAEAQREFNLLLVKGALSQYIDISAEEQFLDSQIDKAGIDVNIQAKKEKAQIELFANVTGTGGLSIDSLMQDVDLNEGKNIGILLDNQDQELDNLYREAKSIRASAIAGQRQVFTPSGFSSALTVVGAGLQGFAAGQGLENSIARNNAQQTELSNSSNLSGSNNRVQNKYGLSRLSRGF